MTKIFDQTYSKEVLKHVKNPKNIGEIKDADGVATVGNPVCGDVMRLYIKVDSKKDIIKDIKFQTLGCFPPQEEIVSADGRWKQISNVQKGVEVINSNGQETFVAETYIREYKGQLLNVIPFVSPFNSFSLTPNHPVLCLKRSWVKGARKSSSKCNWLRVGTELTATELDYVKAQDLEKGDFLVFVVNQHIADDRFFTKEFMRLLGYYLAEGYVTAGSVINFSFGQHEEALIQETKQLIYKIIGKETSSRTRRGATEIRVCSKKWSDIFLSLGGKLARHKALSPQVLLLPFEKQWETIQTFMEGDGDVYKRRPHNSETYRATTTSKVLALQIQVILARGGIFASIRQILKTDCQIEGRKLKDSIQYLISFKMNRKHMFVRKYKHYFLIPIKVIEQVNYSGLVHNFQTAFEPNSYLVRGFAVHNCGAAIATSSMITTLAKGKTLDEAQKITEEGLVQALGGLPSIKIHCSVLAAEALKKAIQDYRSKTIS